MIKKFFIPHSENDFNPHVFREASVIAILSLVLFVFVACSFLLPALQRSDLTAAIYSSVIIENTNKDRGDTNLPALSINPLLKQAAQEKAEDMASKSYFAHNSPDGLTPWYWIKKAGYQYVYAGENLAINFSDSKDVEEAWMNSPGHRANILNNHFTEIGVGIADGEIDGEKTTFVVEMFGSPKNTSTAVLPSKPAPSVSQDSTGTPVSVIARPTSTTSSQSATEANVQEIQVLPAQDAEKEVVSNNGTFVAVKNIEGESVAILPLPSLVFASNYEPSWYEKFLVNPSEALKITYLAIIGFIILSLLLYIFIEWRIQHPKNIFYALLLIIITLVLFLIYWLVFPTVIVIT